MYNNQNNLPNSALSNKTTLIKAGLLILLMLVLWFVYSTFIATPTLINVVGTGKVMAQPEQAEFSIVVINSANSSTQAFTENRRLVRNLGSILKASGVEEKNIDTSYARVADTGTDFQAVNSIVATTNNLSEFDNLMIQLYGNGASSVSNIIFSTNNSKELEREAVSLAIAEAKSRAKELAKDSKKRLGKMVSITTSEAGEAGAISGSQSETMLGTEGGSPSQIEIVRQVGIVFELR